MRISTTILVAAAASWSAISTASAQSDACKNAANNGAPVRRRIPGRRARPNTSDA